VVATVAKLEFGSCRRRRVTATGHRGSQGRRGTASATSGKRVGPEGRRQEGGGSQRPIVQPGKEGAGPKLGRSN
jgi:hypothetical protein